MEETMSLVEEHRNSGKKSTIMFWMRDKSLQFSQRRIYYEQKLIE